MEQSQKSCEANSALSMYPLKRPIFKEAPYSWFSLKHFLYRSESSRDSRVESSKSGEIFKNYI